MAIRKHELEPAATVVFRLGGVAAVADATGVHWSRVYSWMSPKAIGGTGGLIPHRHHAKLLAYARKHKKRLRPQDFFRMGEEELA